MNYWPDGMKVGPIGDWPGERTARPTRSNFSSTMRSTMDTLRRELREIRAKNVELLIAIDPSKFRLDGYPRAGSTPDHPGIILSFDTEYGHLSYPCDSFIGWENNLRAIALSMESLRRVDRYGVTKRGEQYRGFLALEATAMPAGFATAADAEAYIYRLIEPHSIAGGNLDLAAAVRRAQRVTHPDTGGEADEFQRVSAAESKLRAEGLL